jgi:hypothetical protein
MARLLVLLSWSEAHSILGDSGSRYTTPFAAWWWSKNLIIIHGACKYSVTSDTQLIRIQRITTYGGRGLREAGPQSITAC